eukprot:7124085-Alexandrium_andersonii.AAC.1
MAEKGCGNLGGSHLGNDIDLLQPGAGFGYLRAWGRWGAHGDRWGEAGVSGGEETDDSQR